MSKKIIVTFAIYFKKTGKFKIINNSKYSNLEMIDKIGIDVSINTYNYYSSKLRNGLIDKWESDDFIIKIIDNEYSDKYYKLTKEFFTEEKPIVENKENDSIRKIIKDCIKVFNVEEGINALHNGNIINKNCKNILIDLINTFK